MVFNWEEEKPKRTRMSKVEWEALKKLHRNRCCICGLTEKQAGILEKAHVKAHSKMGTQYFPLCPTCHKKYDKGLLNVTEMKKIGIDKKTYDKLRPKKQKKSNGWFF